jgi:hypothetical protein
VKIILLFFQNFSCLCRVINLIIPVTPDNPRADLCCAIQRVSEFLACVLQVLINAITALAMGAQDDFAYYREGLFYNDVSALFDVLLEVIYCACVLIRGIFPLNYIPGFRESVRFDPCCLPERLAVALVETIRGVTLMVISLATITVSSESFCFFRLDTTNGCSGFLDEIGIVKRFDAIVMALLPVSDSGSPGSCKDYCGKDQGRNGVVPCICEIFNTIIPWRDDPSKPVSCEPNDLNCQRVDLCCFFVQAGFAVEQALRFLSRFTVALWQPWTPLPEFAIHFMFCDENIGLLKCGEANNACAFEGLMPTIPTCNCGTFTCGRINPIINSLTDATNGLISRCVCELFRLLDDLLVMIFEAAGSSWRGCFCGIPNGSLRSGPLVIDKLLTALVGFLRKFPLPCYWSPSGVSFTSLDGVSSQNCTLGITPQCVCVFEKRPITSVENSWIFSFLGPTISAMCISVGNLACFINSIFFIPAQCLPFGRRFMGSSLRWAFQLPLLIISTIEGFVRQFTESVPTCVGSNPMCDTTNTGSYQGMGASPLGQQLTALFSWAVDSMLGDSRVACSRICRTGIIFENTCSCYQESPRTSSTALNTTGVSVWQLRLNGTNILGFPQYMCQIVGQPVGRGDEFVQNLLGVNGLRGDGATFPICQALNDIFTGNPEYPGSCAKYQLCRPDSLPRCEVPDGVGDLDSAYNIEGPVDGQLNGLMRWFSCAIGSTDAMLPILTFNSIIWQIYGAIMRFVASIIIFVLSFGNLSGGCDCHNYADPKAAGREVKHIRGTGIHQGFCYACPDANGMCGQGGTPTGLPLFCQGHCPFFQTQRLEEMSQNSTNSTSFTYEEHIDACVEEITRTSNSDWWRTQDARELCTGEYQERSYLSVCGPYPNPRTDAHTACVNQQILGWILTFGFQQSCPKPYCQRMEDGGLGVILYPGVPGRDPNSGSVVPHGPKVPCWVVDIMTNFLSVVNAFTAIFTDPIMFPDMKRSETNKNNPLGRAKTRESRENFWKRTGITRQYPVRPYLNGTETRHEIGSVMEHAPVTHAGGAPDDTTPSAPEMLFLAMYDFDTDDCYDDPVTCLCRNFHMPQHCQWSPTFGVIPASIHSRARKRHALQYRASFNETDERFRRSKREPEPVDFETVSPDYNLFNTGDDQIYPEEVLSVMTESFTGKSPCDRTVCGCALETWDTLPHTTKEMWVECIEKRIQGERVGEGTNGVVPSDIMYHAQAPLFAFENLVGSYRKKAEKHTREMRHRSARRGTKLEERFPDLQNQLIERRQKGAEYLEMKQGIPRNDPMFNAYLDLDEIYLKWSIGFYGFLANETFDAFKSGDWNFPSTESAAAELKEATRELFNTIKIQPYGELWESSKKSVQIIRSFVSDVIETGAINYVVRLRQSVDQHFERRAEINRPRRELAFQRLYNTPLYKWWSMPATENKGMLAPFLRHLQNLIKGYRENWKKQPFNLWSADLRVKGAVEARVEQVRTPTWSPEQLENWNAVGRVYYRIYDSVWPGHLPQHERERFLFTGNCIILSRALETTLRIADYCINVNARDFPDVAERIGLTAYINATSHRRNGYFHNAENMKRYEYVRPSDPSASIRLQMINQTFQGRSTTKNIERRVYKRATFQTDTGPGGFNFLEWFTSIVEDVTSFMFSTNVEGWLDDVRAWIANPNTEEVDYPNVGLRYWGLFLIRCEWPDNINCSKGVGLEAALIWVTVGFIAAYLIGGFILPPILWPFSIIAAPILWAIAVGVIGIHYSPRCLFLVPSLTGGSIAFPTCALDEVIKLTDKYITNCYVPLIIPACMVAGDACPADPSQFIDIVNCQLVGVSDGLQHVIFLLYILFGESWSTFVVYAASLVGFILPGAPQYAVDTLSGFQNAYDTMRCRQWWCFGLTSPAIALPILLFALFFITLGLLVPLIIALAASFWEFFEASPYSAGIPGGAYDGQWDDPDDAIEAEEANVFQVENPSQLAEITSFLRTRRI